LTQSGNFFVLSGPSGVGKGTILHEVLDRIEDAWYSISATTRLPRAGEQHGVDYYFLSEAEFDELLENDGLLEWATVHGKRYGTPRKEIAAKIAQGISVLGDIDVQGALQIKESMPGCVLIFIEPPSAQVLEKRLRGRATDTQEQIALRLNDATHEMSLKGRYNYTVVNDDLSRAAGEVVSIIKSTLS
jgi:guanylate kinase